MVNEHFKGADSGPENPEAGFKAGVESLPSEEHLERNEDAALCDEANGVFGVFDGMGGHQAGEVASRMARDFFAARLGNLPPNLSPSETAETIKGLCEEVAREVLETVKSDPIKYKGMGSTATIVRICRNSKERKAVVANMGDSRVYKFSPDGRLEQLTLDDSRWRFEFRPEDRQQAYEFQRVWNNASGPADLPEKMRGYWNIRHIIWSAIGHAGSKPSIDIFDLEDDDELLITSDGVTDNLRDKDIEDILKQIKDKKAAAQALVNKAREISHDESNPRAKPDDMTAVVVG